MVSQSVLTKSSIPVGTAGGGGGMVATIAAVFNRLWLWVVTFVARFGDFVVVAPTWQRLTLAMQAQQQTNWCWAATSTSVATFYNASTTWTQCTVVNAELGQTTCCSSGGSAACNQPWYLDDALQRVGHLDTVAWGTKTFADVRSEIDNGRPLGVRIGWSGGGGHFLMIDGYLNDSTQHVAVDDPWFGASDITYANLVSGYQVAGSSWTHSYETQP